MDAKVYAMQKHLAMLQKENAELQRKVERGGSSESDSWVQSTKNKKKKKKQEPEGGGPEPGTAAPAQKPKRGCLACRWMVSVDLGRCRVSERECPMGVSCIREAGPRVHVRAQPQL